MNDKVKGLVLSQMDYRENDNLIQIITKEYGHMSLITRGSKKINSLNKIFPMTIYEFIIDYNSNKDIFLSHGKTLIKTYYNDDLKKLSFKNIFLEATLKVKTLDVNIYDDLLFCLEHANYTSGCLFFKYLAYYQGISPYVDGCVICDKSKIIRLDNEKGGFVCAEHSLLKENDNIERLRKFRILNKAGYKQYDKLLAYEYDFSDFKMMIDFFIINSGIHLNSYDFYCRLL